VLNWTFTILEIMWLCDMVEEGVLEYNGAGIAAFEQWLQTMRL
jgi:hypothetical protein